MEGQGKNFQFNPAQVGRLNLHTGEDFKTLYRKKCLDIVNVSKLNPDLTQNGKIASCLSNQLGSSWHVMR